MIPSTCLQNREILILSDSGITPSLYIRLLDPLSQITPNYNILTSSEANVAMLTEAVGLVIVHRWFNTPIRTVAEAAKLRRIPVVYETDDNFLALSPKSAIYLTKEQLNNIERVMTIADAVLCSTHALADFVKDYNKTTIVIQNYGLLKPCGNIGGSPHLAVVNTDYFKLDPRNKDFFMAVEDGIKELDYQITFFGTIEPAMRELQEHHPHRVDIVDKFILNRATFLDRLGKSGVNVAAVPLEESWEHSFKSDIKFLDFASLEIPGIYNNRTVYHAVKHKENGFICPDTRVGWLEGLTFFQSEFNRRQCGRAGRSVVENGRSIDDYVRALADLLETAMRLGGARRKKAAAISDGTATPGGSFGYKSSARPGFGWDDGRLIVYDGSVRRHLVSAELIPVLLDLGLGFFDPDCEEIASAPFGLPVKSEQDLEARGIVGATVRRALPEPNGAARLARDLPDREGARMPDLGRALRIAWIIPGLPLGSGGHRNIFRCAYQLEQRGHELSLYFIDVTYDDATLRKLIDEHFYPITGHIGRFDAVSAAQNDIVMATHWSTVSVAESVRSKVGEVIYFVQDYEASFYPMGSEYVLAEATYRKGFYAITSGLWCEKILRDNFGMDADHFQFPVDRSVYFASDTTPRSNRILFFARPEMIRRCFELGADALRRFHRLRPDVEIAFFGSNEAAHHRLDFPVTQLGLLPTIGDLADLYRTSRAGIVFSTTNPSLVPYEMMACGLPVFDLGRPGNEQNYGDRFDIARLVNPDPAIMAIEIAATLDNDDELRKRSRCGLEFVRSFPTEEEVGRRVEALILERVSKWATTQVKAPSQVVELPAAAPGPLVEQIHQTAAD